MKEYLHDNTCAHCQRARRREVVEKFWPWVFIAGLILLMAVAEWAQPR